MATRRFFNRGVRTLDDRATKSTESFPGGIKVWHESQDAEVDICFIHGLSGNRDSTWTAQAQSSPWPATLLAQKLPHARLLTWGYDAYIIRSSSSASQNQLMDHATNLIINLTDERVLTSTTSRPIIFIAHSLGGLICKDALLLSRNNPEIHLRSVFNFTLGVIFMGTPHRGSWMASWAKIPASALAVVKSRNSSLLAVLGTNDELLVSIQRRFWDMVRELRESGRDFQVMCFFEELGLPVAGQVVPRESATLEGYPSASIHANHSDMVKFGSSEATGFKTLLATLVRWMARSETRWMNAPTVKPIPDNRNEPDEALTYEEQLPKLHMACATHNIETVKWFLDAGADPNERTTLNKWTPLYIASCYGDYNIIGELLDADAEVNATTLSGSTAIREAAMIGRSDIIKLLLNAGARTDLAGRLYNDTPLIVAAAKSHTEAVELLLLAGADVDAQQSGGWCALHYALKDSNAAVLNLILKHSPNVNLATNTGVRPMHLAAMAGIVDIGVELLRRGADINAIDCNGLTALRVAVQQGRKDMAMMLIEAGARLDLVSHIDNLSLVEVAILQGHTVIADYLQDIKAGLSLRLN